MYRYLTRPLMLMALCLIPLAGCKKKPAEEGKPDVRIDVPDSVGSDDMVVAQLKVGDVMNSQLVKETLDALGKIDEGKDTLEQMKKSAESEIGFWPGDVDTVT